MPSSRPNTIPAVVHLLRQIQPRSILDVGVGFGKWGHLFREYTDIHESENDPARYPKKNWHVRIDGIEGFASLRQALSIGQGKAGPGVPHLLTSVGDEAL